MVPLKFPGKIAVIRKPGLHTYIQHFHIPGRNQLAGAVEPDGGNILLEALVHGVLDKPGQIAQGAAFRLCKVCQPDLVHVIFIHILDQTLHPGVSPVDIFRFLPGQEMARQPLQQQVQHLAAFSDAVQAKVILLCKIGLHDLRQHGSQPDKLPFLHILLRQPTVHMHRKQGRENAWGYL